MKPVQLLPQSKKNHPASIVSTTEGLTLLREGIDALLQGEVSTVTLSVESADGEPYKLYLVCLDEEARWKAIRTFYSGKY